MHYLLNIYKPLDIFIQSKDERRTNSALDKRTGGFQPLMSFILENKQSRHSPKHGAEEFRGQPKGGTRTPNRRYKDEDCFSPSVFDINEDFDFEKNLALFDKHTVLAEIDQGRPGINKKHYTPPSHFRKRIVVTLECHARFTTVNLCLSKNEDNSLSFFVFAIIYLFVSLLHKSAI